eukprot:gene39584-48905_t
MELADRSDMTVLHYLVTINVESLTEHFLCGENRVTKALYESSFEAPMEARRDTKGRVALTIAKALRRTRLVALLEEFNSNVSLFRALHVMCHSEEHSEAYTRAADIVFSAHRTSTSRSRFVAMFLKVAMYKLIEKGCFSDALHLLKSFEIRDMSTITYNLYEYGSDVISYIIKGPCNMSTADLNESQLRDALHELLDAWDGASDISEFIVSQRSKPLEDRTDTEFNYSVLNRGVLKGVPEDQRNVYRAYIDEVMSRQRDEQSETRIALLSWAIHELHLPLPELDVLVSHSQFRLLRWLCDSGLVDLNASHHTNDHSDSLICSDRSTTVAEFLCALAASLDELQIFQWLFAEKIADR